MKNKILLIWPNLKYNHDIDTNIEKNLKKNTKLILYYTNINLIFYEKTLAMKVKIVNYLNEKGIKFVMIEYWKYERKTGYNPLNIVI